MGLKGGLTPRHEYNLTKSEWDTPTPRVISGEQTIPESPKEAANNEDEAAWEEEQARLDREWYDYEEFGVHEDYRNSFDRYEDLLKEKEVRFFYKIQLVDQFDSWEKRRRKE